MRILHNETDIGYMPFGYGHRLGANRYEEEFVAQMDSSPISISNHFVRWPSIPNSYSTGMIVELPARTQATRFHPEGREMVWSLHTENREGSSSIADGVLRVGDVEGEAFRLVGTVDEQEKEFNCRIEYKPSLDFLSPRLDMKWSESSPGHVNVQFTAEMPTVLKDQIQSVSIYLNSNRFPLHRDDTYWFVSRPEVGLRGRLTAKVDVPFSEIYQGEQPVLEFRSAVSRTYDLAVYRYHIERSRDDILEALNLNHSISIEASFDPPTLSAEDLFTTNDDFIKCKLEFTANDLNPHVQFNILTNSANKTTNGPRVVEQVLPQERAQEIALRGEIDELSVVVTPVIDGCHIEKLSNSARFRIEVPTKPMIGYCGTEARTWTEHVVFVRGQQASENDVEALLTTLGIGTSEDALGRSEHLRPQLDQIIHRQQYRRLVRPNDTRLDQNSPDFKAWLAELFKYTSDPNPGLMKKRIEGVLANDNLSMLYNTHKPPPQPINPEFTGLSHLYPRQQFQIDTSSFNRGRYETVNRTVYHVDGDRILDVMDDQGTCMVASEGDEEALRSCFGFRSNNSTYTAPGTPGIYYLIEQDDSKTYVFEIEVHGFNHGDDDE